MRGIMFTQGKKFLLNQKGFTLVEVLIALAIVAVALPALVTLVMSQVDGAGHVRDKTYAMWVAENEMTRLNLLNNKLRFADVKLPEKDSRKLDAMGLRWLSEMETGPDTEHPDLPAGIIVLKVNITLLGTTEAAVGDKDAAHLEPTASLLEFIRE